MPDFKGEYSKNWGVFTELCFVRSVKQTLSAEILINLHADSKYSVYTI